MTFVAQHQEPEVLPVDDLLQPCLITKLLFPKIQNQGEHLGKILSDKGWLNLQQVPPFSKCYGEWCASKAGCLWAKRGAGLATWSTLNFQPPQLFKDEPNRNEKLITFIMKNICLVHKQLLQGLFKRYCCLSCWISQPGLQSQSPKPPNFGRALLWEEKYSQQERLCLGSCLLCSQQSLAPAWDCCTSPARCSHIKGQTQLSIELLNPLSSINHVYLFQKFSESCDLSLTWLKSNASGHSICSEVYIISDELKH